MALFAVIITFLLLAGWFALYLVRRDRGEREPAGALWTAFGLGALGLVVAGGLEYLVVPDVFNQDLGLGTILWASIAIGVIEELCKCLPLIFFLRNKRYFNEHTDGVIYFALAGLGFGLPENILYTLEFGAGTGVVRMIMTPLFHAATTALVGYALIRGKLGGDTGKRLTGMLVSVIGLHAAYDFGLFSAIPLLTLLSIMITLALGAGLFLLYIRARSIDQARGLSVVGINTYCRSCGQHNPQHKLYCSHCGKRA